jgi:hypothetical protein
MAVAAGLARASPGAAEQAGQPYHVDSGLQLSVGTAIVESSMAGSSTSKEALAGKAAAACEREWGDDAHCSPDLSEAGNTVTSKRPILPRSDVRPGHNHQQSNGQHAGSLPAINAAHTVQPPEVDEAYQEELESRYVHSVYDIIASHFSATRFAIWPKVIPTVESTQHALTPATILR